MNQDQADALCDHAIEKRCEGEMEEASVARNHPFHHRVMIEYSKNRIAFFQLQREQFAQWKDSDDKVLWLATYDKLIADHTAAIARHESELSVVSTHAIAAE